MTIDSGTIGFLERLNQDASLQDEIQAATAGAGDKTDAVIALAKSKGYSVDRESFEEARAALNAAQSSRALDDADLEGVAGGFNPQPEPPGGVSGLANLVRFRRNLLVW